MATNFLKYVIDVEKSVSGELTCDHLLIIANAAKELKMALLFCYEEAGSSPKTEVDYLAGLAHLELAYCSFKKAYYNQMRG